MQIECQVNGNIFGSLRQQDEGTNLTQSSGLMPVSNSHSHSGFHIFVNDTFWVFTHPQARYLVFRRYPNSCGI